MDKNQVRQSVMSGNLIECTQEEYDLRVRRYLQEFAGESVDNGQIIYTQIALNEVQRLDAEFRAAEPANEAEQRYGETTVSEQPTGDDVPRFQEWECLCGELYPVTFLKCPFCHAERPGIYQ